MGVLCCHCLQWRTLEVLNGQIYGFQENFDQIDTSTVILVDAMVPMIGN